MLPKLRGLFTGRCLRSVAYGALLQGNASAGLLVAVGSRLRSAVGHRKHVPRSGWHCRLLFCEVIFPTDN